MKKLIGTFLFVATFATSAHAAPELFCSYGEVGAPTDYTAGVFDKLRANCEDVHGNQYTLAMDGIGLGLRWNPAEAFTLSCPFVRTSRLVSLPFEGLRISVADVAGADFAVVVNKNLGTCVLTGIDFGFGASVTVDKMTVQAVTPAPTPCPCDTSVSAN